MSRAKCIMVQGTMSAVSYTHLDVYKRQLPGWALLTPLWAKTLAPLQKPSALALPGNWQSKPLHR